MRSGREDLTARARIRDAAVRRFAADGLDAPLRAVAADAGVSAGLVVHHFGSRAGLRTACDEYVLTIIRENKAHVVAASGAPAAMLAQFAMLKEYTPIVGYVLRCLQTGGEVAEHLIDAMVADAVDYFDAGVRAGTIRPSRDPAGRARLLTQMALGSLLLDLPSRIDSLDLDELPAWFESYTERIVLPTLELFTEPVLTDSSLLDAYLATTDGSKR